MAYTIAIAGKGGTGKSTFAALLINSLAKQKKGSVLGVDADPSSNLAEFLGQTPDETIVGIINDIAKNPGKIPTGTSKDRFIEMRVQEAVVEAEGFDLLIMGIPEGPGCYCYANNAMRGYVEKLLGSYDFIVIDNEAGLEHLSRRTTRKGEALFLISQPTVAGIRAVKRINKLVADLEINFKKIILAVNEVKAQKEAERLAKETGINNIFYIPYDEKLLKFSTDGTSLRDLGKDSKITEKIDKICKEVINGG